MQSRIVRICLKNSNILTKGACIRSAFKVWLLDVKLLIRSLQCEAIFAVLPHFSLKCILLCADSAWGEIDVLSQSIRWLCLVIVRWVRFLPDSSWKPTSQLSSFLLDSLLSLFFWADTVSNFRDWKSNSGLSFATCLLDWLLLWASNLAVYTWHIDSHRRPAGLVEWGQVQQVSNGYYWVASCSSLP